MSGPALETIIVCGLFPDSEITRIKENFKTVHYLKVNKDHITPEELKDVEGLFCHNWEGFPNCITSLDEMPKFSYLQVSATGFDKICKQAPIANASPERLKKLYFANSAGGYSTQIGLFVLNYITSLANSIHNITYLARTHKRWPEFDEIMADAGRKGVYGSKTMFGKTFGFLGYGALGREFARLCTIFPQARIIAANTQGKKTVCEVFGLPGTGDKGGDLPEAYFSASDPASLKDFLSQTDVLICSLPGTSETTGLLDSEKLGWLKPNGLFINVGRGSLIESDEIIKAVDRPNGLLGAAIDVTEPEPLPAGHPLFSHPRIIVTPHASGESENELIASTNVLLQNTAKIRKGEDYFNKVDFFKGY